MSNNEKTDNIYPEFCSTNDLSNKHVATENISTGEKNWDMLFGTSMAILAAVLAINDLGAGKFGDDELQTANEKTSSYSWYQSKSIKESLAEGQRDILISLLQAGVINAQSQSSVREVIQEFSNKTQKYKKEKNEILLGSQAVGEKNWVQDVDGKLGKVIGTKDLEQKLEKLGVLGDKFDLASLFLQIGLVIGAIGIIVKNPGQKNTFFSLMLVLGFLGMLFCCIAYFKSFNL